MTLDTVDLPMRKLNDSDCWESPVARYLKVIASFSFEDIGARPLTFSRFLFVWDLALFEVVNAGDQNAQVSFSKTYNQQIGKRNTIYWVSGITENKR